MNAAAEHTHLIKSAAARLGFAYCGVSRAGFLEDEARHLDEWLRRGYHGRMTYMENHHDMRLDPTKLVPGAKSVVSLIYNYCPEKNLDRDNGFKVAKYAYGEDYHIVIREKLELLLEEVREGAGNIQGRAFVDSAPVMERAWASRSGIGWIGKNSLLLNRTMGSFFFLAELIIDLELEYDGPAGDYCGTCTACMDACPTDAIPEPYVVDGSRCISYFTIELREEIPDDYRDQFHDWIFGCDICQDVCPWNRFATAHDEPRFDPNPGLASMTRQEWIEITRETFDRVFRKSPLKRARFEGLKRNINYSAGKKVPK